VDTKEIESSTINGTINGSLFIYNSNWVNCSDVDDYSGSTTNVLITKTPTLTLALDNELRRSFC